MEGTFRKKFWNLLSSEYRVQIKYPAKTRFNESDVKKFAERLNGM